MIRRLTLLLSSAIFLSVMLCSCARQQAPEPVTAEQTEAMISEREPTDFARSVSVDTTTIPYAYAGFPQGHDTELQTLVYTGYAVGFSPEARVPLWACYRLFIENEPDPSRPDIDFASDPRATVTVTHRDYTNSGFDRGHMAPSAAIGQCYGAQAQRETFVTTNICPQHPGLNQRGWEALERRITDDYLQEYGEVWVTAGPIFEGPCEELLSDVRLPSHFYMVLIADEDGQPETLSVIMPNSRIDATPLHEFTVTVDEVERRTGLDFFAPLPDSTENAIEADTTPDDGWLATETLRPSFAGNARRINKRSCD